MDKSGMKSNNNIIDTESNFTEEQDITKDTSKFIQDLNISSTEELNEVFNTLHKGIIKLRALILINNLQTQEKVISKFRNLFIVEEYGDFYKITLDKLKSQSFEAYFWFLPNSTSILLTTFSLEEIIDKIIYNQFLKNTSSFTPLWINQKMVQSLIEKLEFNYDFIMTYFSSEYNKIFKNKAKLRPFVNRKLTYQGNDSLQTYNELKSQYGLVIKSFKGIIKDLGFFGLNREQSIFILQQGNLKKLLDIIQWTYEQSDKYIKEIGMFFLR